MMAPAWRRVTVADTGIGTTEKAALLFEVLSQAEVSTRRTEGGADIGLAIRHRLRCVMGGDSGRLTAEQRSGWHRSARSTAVAADPRAHGGERTCRSVLLSLRTPPRP